ncbi:MAG: hypothetical protein OEX76_07185 [Candidatus Bathyarchaeota archaeon]|nr:hypothetical protein [Candidatus Bathyarchaeota archaeon]
MIHKSICLLVLIEPPSVKERATKSATEIESVILRIDDELVATKPKEWKVVPEEEGIGEEY